MRSNKHKLRRLPRHKESSQVRRMVKDLRGKERLDGSLVGHRKFGVFVSFFHSSFSNKYLLLLICLIVQEGLYLARDASICVSSICILKWLLAELCMTTKTSQMTWNPERYDSIYKSVCFWKIKRSA